MLALILLFDLLNCSLCSCVHCLVTIFKGKLNEMHSAPSGDAARAKRRGGISADVTAYVRAAAVLEQQ